MPQVTSPRAFITLLDKSNLLEGEALEQAHAIINEADDVRAAARRLVSAELITAWQAGKLRQGQHALYLGKYKLLDRLDWAGRQTYYLAEHTQMLHRVALKTLGRRHAQDPESLKRFEAEGHLAASLRHANIVHVVDFEFEKDYYFLVMEYVDGDDLQTVVERDGPLATDRAADYIRQAAAALAYAHGQEVTHRRLEPSRMLVDGSGELHLIELGAARLPLLGDEQPEPASDFAAPEQDSSDEDLPDVQSNLYSLGASLFFLLTGKLPDAEAEDPAAPLTARSNVPVRLVEICRRLLAVDPADRPASAGEVHQELDAWLASCPPLSTPAAPPTKKVLRTRGDSDVSRNEFVFDDDPAPRRPAVSDSGALEVAAPAGGLNWLHIGGIAAGVLVAVVLLVIWLWPGEDGGTVAAKESDDQAKSDTSATVPIDEEEAAEQQARSERKEDEEDKDGFDFEGLHKEKLGGDPDAQPNDANPPDKPAEPKPAEKPTEEQPADAKKPGEDKKPPQEKPAEEKPDKDKPAKEKPPAKKPDKKPAEKKPPPPKDPFVELNRVAPLPVIDATAATGSASLGAVATDKFEVALLGGDVAAKGDAQFSLSGAGDAWEITLEGAKTSPDAAIVVARLTNDDGQLQIEWASSATGHPEASFLRNCLVELTSDKFRHVAQLRQPVTIEPFTVDFDRARATVPLEISDLPDTEDVQLEVINLQGQFPKREFDPDKSVPAEDGTLWIHCGDAEKLLHFKLSSKTSKNIVVMLEAYYQMTADTPPRPLVTRAFSSYLNGARNEVSKMESNVDGLRKTIGKIPNPRKKQQAQMFLQAEEQKLSNAKPIVTNMELVQGYCLALHQNASIRYRVTLPVGDDRVILAEPVAVAAE